MAGEIGRHTGPVYAWRSWTVDTAGVLHSLSYNSDQPFRFTADCPFNHHLNLNKPTILSLTLVSHTGQRTPAHFLSNLGRDGPAPKAGCTCGIYAFTHPEHLDFSLLHPLAIAQYFAHGLVELSGTSVRHEHGWRSQHVVPRWLYLEPHHQRGDGWFRSRFRRLPQLAPKIAAQYRVPVDVAPRWTTTERDKVVDRGFCEAYRRQMLVGAVPPLETVNLHELAGVLSCT